MNLPKFGYKCPECGKGVIRRRKIKNYKTKFWNIAFVVPFAHIGVCSACKRKNFDPTERRRWERLFWEKMKER